MLSERVFNLIDRSRYFIEVVTGVDLLAIANLPSAKETFAFLSKKAEEARKEVAKLERVARAAKEFADRVPVSSELYAALADLPEDALGG